MAITNHERVGKALEFLKSGLGREGSKPRAKQGALFGDTDGRSDS